MSMGCKAGRRAGGQADGTRRSDGADKAVIADMSEKGRTESRRSELGRPPSGAVVWSGSAGSGGGAKGARRVG